MKFNQVLVVFKQLTSSRAGQKGESPGQRLHLETLDILYPMLKRLGISFETCSVEELKTIKKADLVVTVGGDGTVLRTSHFVGDIPILGIKSFGHESIGHFCAATTETMDGYLKSLITGRVRPKKLHRLEVTIGRHHLKELALNDVLFAHGSPASTTRYILTIGGRSEMQRSSGIWISSAAGSTAAASAAGGRKLPLSSKKMQYVVREPYAPSKRYSLLTGVLPNTSSIKITSLVRHGTVYIDGPNMQYPAPEGTVVTVTGAKRPVNIFWRRY